MKLPNKAYLDLMGLNGIYFGVRSGRFEWKWEEKDGTPHRYAATIDPHGKNALKQKAEYDTLFSIASKQKLAIIIKEWGLKQKKELEKWREAELIVSGKK